MSSNNGTRMESYAGDQLMGASGQGYLRKDTDEENRNLDDSPWASSGDVSNSNHINNFELWSGGPKTYFTGWIRGFARNAPLADGNQGWKSGDRCMLVYDSIG